MRSETAYIFTANNKHFRGTDTQVHENLYLGIIKFRMAEGIGSDCDHGLSCCKKCRQDLEKLRSEFDILRVQLQVPHGGLKDSKTLLLPGLDDSDTNEHASIMGCLEAIEMNTKGEATRFKVKDAILEALRNYKDDRPYVARRLTDLLFTKLERKISNVQGKKNKRALDPQRMAAVRDGTFQVCPAPKNDQEPLWKECIRSIDSASRGLSRDRKQPTKRLREKASSSSSSAATVVAAPQLTTISSLVAASNGKGNQQQQQQQQQPQQLQLQQQPGTVLTVPVTSTVQDYADGPPAKAKMIMLSLPAHMSQ